MSKKPTLSQFVVLGENVVTLQLGAHTIKAHALAAELEAVSAGASLQVAAREIGTTYRTLWGRFETYAQAFGVPLLEKSPGIGTQLAASGEALLAALRAELPPRVLPTQQFAKLTAALTHAVGAASSRLRLYASHDFALAHACAQPQCAQLDLHNAGSEEAVRALVAGTADLAGFHTSAAAQNDGAHWLARLREKPNLWIEPLMEREQGLLIAKRNPLKLRGLSDLARPGVRFVNRQRGSGTRALLDMLLQSEGVRTSAINGYAREEFTHEAVAAMIAAGAADAGLGLRAAAAQFKLEFIPLGNETYYLAGKRALQGQGAVKVLIDTAKAQAATLPGYRAL